MNTHALVTLTLAALAAQACDSIPFIGGNSQASADSAAADSAAAAAAPTAAAPAAPENPNVAPLPDEPAFTPPSAAAPLSRSPDPIEGEMSWNPERTGVVDPGMSSAAVVETWGEPAAQRVQGNFTYMYFRNGCETSCGMFDLVILEGDQVIDAIVRGFGHDYSGVSSSPANVAAVANVTSN